MSKQPLSVTHPEIAAQWSERNLPLTPDQVTYGGHDNVWWKCEKGHEWRATVGGRTRGNGCPYCGNKMHLKGFNDMATRRPDMAEAWSDKNLPLTPSDVMPHARRRVWWKCTECGAEYQSTINQRSHTRGLCPDCLQRSTRERIITFAMKHPELEREWSPRNAPLTFDQVSTDCQKTVWWICPDCGREYHRQVWDKIHKYKDCPYCTGVTLAKGFNDLATTHPILARQWDKEKSGGWLPEDVTERSKKYVWWNCPCGHSWGARVRDRTWYHASCIVCDAEFGAVLPLMVIMTLLKEKGYSFEVCRTDGDGETFGLYCEELHFAADIGGVSEEKIRELSVKQERLREKGITYTAFHVTPDHEAAMNAVAESLRTVGVGVEENVTDRLAAMREWFDHVRPAAGKEETTEQEKGGTEMDEDLKLLLKLMLEREEQTEAGQDVKAPRKKKTVDPEKGIDHDPSEKPARKLQVSEEIIKRYREKDLENARRDMYETHENNVASMKEVPIWEKYALSVTEATKYFHIGRKKLREIINRDKYANYLVWNGGHVFIKRKLFEEYLDHEVQL